MVRIGIFGCAGRMGRLLVAEAHAAEGASVAGGCEAPGSPFLGADIGELAGIGAIGLQASPHPAALIDASDVVVDFTAPGASVVHARLAAERGKAAVIGTTGLDRGQEESIAEAARRVPILRAANVSLGVTLLSSLVEEAARRLGPDWDIEIVEMHHNKKVDAPSGTALVLGEAAAKGRGVDLHDVAQRARDGHTGPRREGDIGFAVLRGGDVAGEHTVIFATAGERIELGHRATTRQIFARGAIRAALWLAGKKPGLYGMKDVLGLG
jgi:4-hydroxy-tetrahydrodipicolinate reductase